MKIKQLLLIFIAFSSMNSQGQSNQTELECKGSGKVAILNQWGTVPLADEINAGNYSYFVTIKNQSITINDKVLKKIPHKFERDDGYKEYGGFVSRDSEHIGFYFYQKGEFNEPYHLLEHYDLRLYRLSGEFQFSNTFYMTDIKKSDYKSYNKYGLNNAYVHTSVRGTCKKVQGKQKF